MEKNKFDDNNNNNYNTHHLSLFIICFASNS